ncbi:MAG: CoA-binding protein [Desulfurispora sp.]|uniref:CoA-binding protein n=1 Tax=Desulfurispora sp. TaxID=3014275 RepID=UPI00404A8749
MFADQQIKAILQEARTIAVVGLSDKPQRDSYRVAEYLQRQGYRIIPVNPTIECVLGERSYPSLAAVPGPVDIVDIFRRSEEVPPVVAEALEKKPRLIWLQRGVVSPQAAELAAAAGVPLVMDRCLKVEHGRLLG